MPLEIVNVLIMSRLRCLSVAAVRYSHRHFTPLPAPLTASYSAPVVLRLTTHLRHVSTAVPPPPPFTSPSTTSDTSSAWMSSLSMEVPHQDNSVDPFRLVSDDLSIMTRSIRDTVSVLQHPALDRAASHLLSLHGKRIRPIIVLLMAHATASLPSAPCSSSAEQSFTSQIRLAEITELIHAASLLHDDVIDVADTRRGAMSVNSLFGNQLAVLAGDFLLARASVALARLRDCDVVELLSTVIEHLVRGEVLQMRTSSSTSLSSSSFSSSSSSSRSQTSYVPPSTLTTTSTTIINDRNHFHSNSNSDSQTSGNNEQCHHHLYGGIGDTTRNHDWFHHPTSAFDTYLSKTFFKTASLVANSCRAVTMLANHPPHVSDAAFAFGEGVGMAFQLIDDLLDLTSSSSMLGKPVLNDLRQGVITAPVLFAAEEFPQVHTIINRRFSKDGDLDLVVDYVHRADGVAKTRLLARQYAQRAVSVIVDVLPPSEHRSALVNIADFILTRKS